MESFILWEDDVDLNPNVQIVEHVEFMAWYWISQLLAWKWRVWNDNACLILIKQTYKEEATQSILDL